LCLLCLLSLDAGAKSPALMLGAAQFVGSGSKDGGIEAFLGVPFAQPPVGAKRWRSAQPIAYPPGRFDATAFAPACYQGDHITRWYRGVVQGFGGDPATVVPPAVAEDCLYLNLWRPQGAGRPLPIIVYVHGGSNQGGWSYEPNYIGENLARQDVIVISVAYRLGVFGFFAHPDLAEANFALSDLVEALRWIRQYAGAFGGDVTRITLLGESAGASNIAHLLAMPQAQGLFQRVIHQSAGWAISASVALEEARALGTALQQHLGGADIDALRELPAGQLNNAAASVYAEAGFDPVVDRNGLPAPLSDLLPTGNLPPVELLIGSNANEWKMYLDPEQTLDGWLADSVTDEQAAGLRRELGDSRENDALDRLITAVNFACPSLRLAEALARHNGKVWVYYFSRQREGEQAATMGAYHGAELPYVFGTHDDWLPTSAVDQKLTGVMMAYWANFARSGDPGGKGLPPWPAYGPGAQVLELGTRVGVVAHPSAGLCRILDAQ
jgi:para-nitrobenzyl esterase